MSEDIDLSDVSLDEIRRIHDFEESRRISLESKASSVLGFATLIVTILIFVLNYFFTSTTLIVGFQIFVILSTISIVILIKSLFNLIDVFKIRIYPSPFDYDPNKIRKKFLRPSEEVKNYLLDNYRRTIPKIHALNDQKATSLDKSIKLLVFGITLAIISPLILLWLKLFI